MRNLTLVDIFNHPITRKYLRRSGIHHAVSVAYQAFELAKQRNLSVDLATKAGLLHDIGHYEWYRDGKWDYNEYRKHDIHAIKGAERSHKLLIRLGEDGKIAKEISLAILLHTDSFLPFSLNNQRTPIQQIVADADELAEEPKGLHHYKQMEINEAIRRLNALDQQVAFLINNEQTRER